MSAARKPDAVLYQPWHKQGPDHLTRVKIVQDRFGPILGSPNVVSTDIVSVGILCLPDKDLAARSYLTVDRLPRYDWIDQPDGTRFGYLKSAGGAPSEEEAAVAPAAV